MEYLLDESGLQKLVHLLADRPSLEFVEAPQALLDRLGVRQDIKGVLGDLPWDARHIRGAPREDVCVGAEKADEHHFLFVVEGGADLQRLVVGAIRVEGHLLDTLGRFEASHVSVRGVQGLACHFVEGGCEGLVLRLSLRVLNALHVALVGVLERRADGDDTLRTWHLQLEVGVVGDGHELGVVGTTKDGMIGYPKPHHLKGEYFLAEVGCRAKADRQIDLAEGLDSPPRRNSMKRRLARAKLVQSNPHELQGVGVHDVEPAASVYEHLGEAGVSDDGVDNKWVPSRMRDIVEVVFAAKGNGVLRPVEVGRRGHCDGEDFPTLALALPRGHVHHWPSKDEEGVLYRGELVISTFVASILLLVLVAMRDAVVVLLEHLALLEGMVD